MANWIIYGCITNLVYTFFFKKRISDEIIKVVEEMEDIIGPNEDTAKIKNSAYVEVSFVGLCGDILLFPLLWIIIFTFLVDKIRRNI